MLSNSLYPLLDVLFYPLFYLPTSWGLTVVSILAGVGLLALYAVSSDQWAMAYYKEELKKAQWSFQQGGSRWDDLKRLMVDNVKMAKLGLVPSVVCIGALLLIIPWVGNRFGHRPIQPMEPFEVTVNADQPWLLEINESTFRVSSSQTKFSADTTTLRMLVEDRGGYSEHSRTLLMRTSLSDTETIDKTMGNPCAEIDKDFFFSCGPEKQLSVSIPIKINRMNPPIWPTVSAFRWYHHLVRPADAVLYRGTPITRIKIHYEPVFEYLAFYIPYSGRIPGWLSWFFIVSFVSGLVVKFQWEIE